MSLLDKIQNRKNVANTGFSEAKGNKTARFIFKDGTPNVRIKGTGIFNSYSQYHWLINLPSWKFILVILCFYTSINFIFATIYYLFCMPNLMGLKAETPLESFEEAYFFSSQTLTTVGYGRISPIGFFTNTVAALEALIGILTLAIITGLLYGRFVKPKAYIKFSDNALIAPFKSGKALMFRLVPIKHAKLSEVFVQVTASLMVEENGVMVSKYYVLPLQFDKINMLNMNWTVVHPLDDASPLKNLSFKDLDEGDLELMIYLKAYDEDFSNTVVSRTSYTIEEIVNGAKYDMMYYDGQDATVLDISKLNNYTVMKEAAL